jgi:hypothetical protein
MANVNRQTDNRDAKRRRRRREVRRMIAALVEDSRTAQGQGQQPEGLARKIRVLRRTMRVNG